MDTSILNGTGLGENHLWVPNKRLILKHDPDKLKLQGIRISANVRDILRDVADIAYGDDLEALLQVLKDEASATKCTRLREELYELSQQLWCTSIKAEDYSHIMHLRAWAQLLLDLLHY